MSTSSSPEGAMPTTSLPSAERKRKRTQQHSKDAASSKVHAQTLDADTESLKPPLSNSEEVQVLGFRLRCVRPSDLEAESSDVPSPEKEFLHQLTGNLGDRIKELSSGAAVHSGMQHCFVVV